jgi:hypothetical protein
LFAAEGPPGAFYLSVKAVITCLKVNRDLLISMDSLFAAEPV